MLKYLFTIVLFPCLSFSCFTQESVEDWVYKGIDLHEQGQYDKAIIAYKKALKIDKKSTLVFYEMAFAYMEKGDYKNAVKYSKKVLKINKNYLLESYLIHSSALDLMGKPEKGIQALEKATKKYPKSHLAFFNLGILYNKTKNQQLATQALTNAIKAKPNHASSHLALAQVQLRSENMNNAALSYIYFLLLEPDSPRSKMAHHYLSTVMDSPKYNVKKADETQAFFKDLEILFESLSHQKEVTDQVPDIYSNFYIPVFNSILAKGLTETLEYYIGQYQGVMYTTWLKQHSEKVDELLRNVNEITPYL